MRQYLATHFPADCLTIWQQKELKLDHVLVSNTINPSDFGGSVSRCHFRYHRWQGRHRWAYRDVFIACAGNDTCSPIRDYLRSAI